MYSNLYVDIIPGYGRSIIAAENIYGGELVMVNDTLVLSEQDTKTLSNTQLWKYTYSLRENQDLICLGIGSLLNHSEDPNLDYTLTDDSHPRLHFRALRNIKAGEQLFINYSKDCKVDIKDYL